jgi:hypothetical protein
MEKAGKLKVCFAIFSAKCVWALLMVVYVQMIYVMLEHDCTPFARGAYNDHVIWLYIGEQLFYR